MAGAGRFDLSEETGKAMPDTLDELADAMKAVHMNDGLPAFLTEDLTPLLNTPEAIAAADY